ncbi:MAG: superoxide dismutase [Porphyromonas sp.]|nr:superoxide dismutase [Porphyromonas sp.]MDO4771088.1 superoxide dismutase [Porphyromonas sp.]
MPIVALGVIAAPLIFTGATGKSEKSTAAVEYCDDGAKTPKQIRNMKFELVKLPYATDALAPVISKRTVELHHGKHLQAYVDNLNRLIEGTPFADKDLVTIVKESDGGIFNNAGQNLNHILYFLQFSPNGGAAPTGELADAIAATFGDFEKFKAEFEAAAVTVFGSGWAWLACDKDGKLQITKEANAGNPVTKGLVPLMGIDVWEHAYYLDYENRRAEHLKKVWDIIDWNVVAKRYQDRGQELIITK